MDFNYVLKIFIKFFFVTFVIFWASISYSQDDEFNLESDDFDLLEDSLFDLFELELEKTLFLYGIYKRRNYIYSE